MFVDDEAFGGCKQRSCAPQHHLGHFTLLHDIWCFTVVIGLFVGHWAVMYFLLLRPQVVRAMDKCTINTVLCFQTARVVDALA